MTCLEKPPEPPGLRAAHHQLHAGVVEQLLSVCRSTDQGEIPEDPAADLPGQRQGADEGWTGHHHPQGQDPHDFTPRQAVLQADAVRQETKNRCR